MMVQHLLHLTTIVLLTVAVKGLSLDNYAFCGDCWCIPEDGEACPTDSMPNTDWSEEFISHLLGLTLENPIEIPCDPYKDETCEAVPPLETGGVCAYELISNGNCPEEHSYRLYTMESREEAEANGLYVTHEGACGACSTLQDLVVFMTKPDLTEVGINCGFRSLINFEDGVACYSEHGFSTECAKIWIYNTINTQAKCPVCIIHATSDLPNNLPAPGCELAECMQCDEDESGPLFKEYGGRTRRGSGLMSKIARPCSSVPKVFHEDPCNLSTPAPTSSTTKPLSTVDLSLASVSMENPTRSPTMQLPTSSDSLIPLENSAGAKAMVSMICVSLVGAVAL